MTLHPSDSQFEAFIRRISTPDELIEFDRHVQGCAECRSRLQNQAAVGGLRRALESGMPEQHLSYEQVVGLAEGQNLPEAGGHLANCERCRAEVNDLRDFARASRRPGRTRMWAVAAAAIFVVALMPVIWKLSHRPGSQLVAALHDAGGTVGLDQNGNLHGSGALSPEYSGLVAESLKTGRLEVQGIAEGLSRNRETLLGAPQAENHFALAQPVGEAVLTDRPMFSWNPLAGASSYRVNVFDEQFLQVAESPELSGTTWTPLASLPRKHAYSWTITARVGHSEVREPVPPAPEAKFVILSAEEAERLRTAAERYPDAHLLLASLYAKAGAIEDARRELQALESANPGSELARRLQDSLSRAEHRP